MKIGIEIDWQPRHLEALGSILDTDPDIPIMFGGGTEYMIALAAETADGLLPNGSWSPGMMKVYRPMIEKGFARRESPPRIEASTLMFNAPKHTLR